MAFKPPQSLSPFAQHLVSEGLLAAAQADELSDQARAEETSLLLYLENKKWLSASILAEAASHFFSLPLYNLDAHQTDKMPIEFMSLDIVKRGLAIPLMRKKNVLYFGVTDPEPIHANELSFATAAEIKLVIVEADKFRALTTDIHETQTTAAGINTMIDDKFSDLEITPFDESTENLLTENLDEKPIVAYLNRLLLQAIKLKASDIHFEPFEKYFRIRFRIDGILHEASRAPIQVAGTMVTRLKVLSNLDIAEHRLPLDGRFKIALARDKPIDFRISTCPTIYGEKVVLRILDPNVIPLDSTAIGMEADQLALYMKSIYKSQGIVLVTGPTGSGKTVTLYTALKLLNSIQKNICTVEDPIEINMSGVNQVHMNAKTGLSFAKALRAFLRQDPDIIMVGEIRDLETADIAIKASQTGHLVLSTLHTNSAPMTLIRLTNMGVEPYNIASALTLVIAQRLLRKLCKFCKKAVTVNEDLITRQGFYAKDLVPGMTVYEAGQCSKCTNGYKGRIGIYEIMPVTTKIRDLILRGGNVIELTELAEKEGMINLRQSGIKKIKDGITSLDELNRVISSED